MYTFKRTKGDRLMLVTNCVVFGKKKRKLIKDQEVH